MTTLEDLRPLRRAAIALLRHVLMENRSGLVVGPVLTRSDALGERAASSAMLDTVPGSHPKTSRPIGNQAHGR